MNNLFDQMRNIDPDDMQKLESQLCFPLYAASMLITRLYKPILEPYGLTYTQYIALLYLWESAPCSVGEICRKLMLNTNTVTPMLKKLEQKDILRRTRSEEDERTVTIELTDKGKHMQSICKCVPQELVKSINFPLEDAVALKNLLNKLVPVLSQQVSS